MALDEHKFKSLIHYVCWRCRQDPSTLGAVKLNKILWLSDFRAYYDTGDSITGARYVKRQFGPVPSRITSALRDLQTEGAISVGEAQFRGFPKAEYTVHRDPNTAEFKPDELAIVDKVIEFVCNEHTAKSISEMSHDHVWQVAGEGEEIPYYTIFAVPGQITDDEREWARQELEELK